MDFSFDDDAKAKAKKILSPLKLMAVIGDEETCVGFIMAGIGDIDNKERKNFMVVTPKTIDIEIEMKFNEFLKRRDIAIILINQNAANRIRKVVDAHDKPEPAILEIPSSQCPYDPAKDSILHRARKIFHGELNVEDDD